MKVEILTRRDFCRLSLLVGFAGLTGCGRSISKPILRAASETLPKELLRALPDPWFFSALETKAGLKPSQLVVNSSADLLAIGDGWLSEFSKEVLLPIEAGQISSRLDKKAQEFINSFGLEISSRIFPIGVSPWVMLFRNGQDFLPRAQKGWDVLLDPVLAGSIVLPESPRLVISIADRMEGTHALIRLRKQALTFDDRNGLNWVLSGRARVAILPLFRCFGSLSRDPRLSVAFPESGAPLNWTVLVRPSSSKQPFPLAWMEEAWSMPLLGKLLARGWVPPLPHEELRQIIRYIPDKYKTILLPPESVWFKSWSLSSLPEVELNRLESIWKESTP